MSVLPDGAFRRAFVVATSYVLLSAGLAFLGTIAGELVRVATWVLWYVGAGAVLLIALTAVGRQFEGRGWLLLTGLVFAVVLTAAAAVIALILIVNIWERAGLAH